MGSPTGPPYQRSCDSLPCRQLVRHCNGAVTPIHHANFAATANHLATKGYYGYAGHLYGKREAEADAQLITYTNGAVVPVDQANIAATNAHILSKGVVAYPYAYGVHPFLVGHPNGAVVPVEPYDVVKARADHLAAVAAA